MVALVVALAHLSPVLAESASFEFRLVPRSDWQPHGEQNAAVLPEGRILLYREGSYTPERIVPANEVSKIPAGNWVWIAEAEGFVSVVGGTLKIPSHVEQPQPKVLYWPVVPACRVVLDPSANWAGVQRLDVVSVTQDAVYPVVPTNRREAWVPAGRLLSYGVGTRGLQGIDDLGHCTQGQMVTISPPAPPDAYHQELMVTAYLPAAASSKDERANLAVLVAPQGGRPRTPDAQVWVGNRVSSFFLDVPADRDLDLSFRHPKLRSRVVTVESLGGSARELPEERLERRLDLKLDIDYRPLQPHKRHEVVIGYCGTTKALDLRTFRNCKPLEQRKILRAGLHSYTFRALDDGLYYLEAWIDDFVVPELGAFVRPFLDPAADHAPTVERGLLYERHIHGRILLDGKPVQGTVNLLAAYEKQRRLPDHHYPAGDDGRYNLFYFGRLPGPYAKPPGFEDSSNPGDNLGIYGDYQLTACSQEGFCRPFSLESVLQGGGRLDLTIGDRTEVEVRVVDRETGKPIEDALVAIPPPKEALYFHHGEVDCFKPAGSEGSYLRTDAQGMARILPEQGVDKLPLIVHQEGYETVRKSFALVPGERNQIEVSLVAKQEVKSGLRLVFPDGAPLVSGFMMAFDRQSGLEARCSSTISPRGFVDLPANCLLGRTVVLIAPGARIETFEGTALSSFGEITVHRAPPRPLKVRVVDEDSKPVAGVPVFLRYPNVRLGPNEFLMAATATGYQAFLLTDERGELLLRGVDPEAVTVPDVGIMIRDEIEWESLSPYQRGDTVTIPYKTPQSGN